eukprot:Clim_evm44s240 gene=Clim_evmTU44s240
MEIITNQEKFSGMTQQQHTMATVAPGAMTESPRQRVINLSETVSLQQIRNKLIELEDTIMRGLMERAQYKLNAKAYVSGGDGVEINGSKEVSYFDYLFKQTEQVHRAAGRFQSFDSKPFYRSKTQSRLILRGDHVPDDMLDTRLNATFLVKMNYLNGLHILCEDGDDNQYGDAIVRDIMNLQAISQRVHYGAAVMEAKYAQDPEGYQKLLRERDDLGIFAKLRDVAVEKKVLERVWKKAERIGLQPEFIVQFYERHIIPLTIQVEVDYLFLKWERMSME